ncbi:MAG: DUF971 domain-containing protein [Bryobacteraceae bacterium]|nr:DUF971 domain-containing protein [Bryobacteraceae bacterium]
MIEPEHIAISKSKGIKIDWSDGHHSEYPLSHLRDECPCASCTGAHGTEPQKTSYSKPDKPANPFQMYKPPPRILSVEEVGNYAIRIHWSDGHSSGIYSWEVFRRICPCEACRAAAATP